MFYSTASVRTLQEILHVVQIIDEDNEVRYLPLENIPPILPEPLFPNNKFEFSLSTLLSGNASFEIRLHILCEFP